MRDLIRSTLIGFVSGVIGALIVVSLISTDEATPKPVAADDSNADLLERIAALEDLVASGSDLAVAQPTAQQGRSASMASAGEVDLITNDAASVGRESRAGQRRQDRRLRIETNLREAGWSDAEIDSLEQIRTAAGLEMERRQFAAMREEIEKNPEAFAMWQSRSGTLRKSLGDARYEQYLEAGGRSAAATVNHVLSGSAGESAGLQPGDEIRRYGSTRIFNSQDLMLAMLEGKPGEPVTIEVERDGATFHVSVPRGPLGTSPMSRTINY